MIKLFIIFSTILCLIFYATNAEAKCLPPKGYKCQPPPATVQQEVRRTLNQMHMGWAWPTFSRIAWCESRWDKNALNGQYRGIFQIGDEYWGWIWKMYKWQWNNPTHNTMAAVVVYRQWAKGYGDGFGAWSCY